MSSSILLHLNITVFRPGSCFYRDSFYLGNRRSTGRTLLSKKAKQQLHLVRAPVHDENEPDISNDDGSDKQDEPYLEGKISSGPLPNRLLSQTF